MFNRWIEDGLLELLGREGVGCIVFSPLAQGLLTDKYLKGIPGNSRAAKARFLKPEHITDDKIERVKKLKKIADERDQSMAELALAWVLRDERVTSALIGASSVKQLESNVHTLQNSVLSDDEKSRIEAILRG